MLFDKCIEYASQEEKKRFFNLLEEYRAIVKLEILQQPTQAETNNNLHYFTVDYANDKENKHAELKGNLLILLSTLQQKYIDAIKREPLRIIDDAREIAENTTKTEYEEFLKNPDVYFDLLPEAQGAFILGKFTDNEEGFLLFLTTKLYLQARVFSMRNETSGRLIFIALKRSFDLGYCVLKSDLNGIDLNTVFDDKVFNEFIYCPNLDEGFKKALKNLQNEAGEEINLTAETLKLAITEKNINAIEYPIDKINNNIWNDLVMAAAKPNEAGQIAFAMEKQGDKPINILYSIDFSNLEEEGLTISKKLTAFDKRIYIACGSLYAAGYNITTTGQIYKAMGNNGKPSATAIKKINDSLTKMRGATIFIDNEQESKAYKYPHFRYDASLLPMERITAIINGQETDSAIKLYREPPLLSFAKQRKQVTTVKRELLASPINKTEQNLLIDDYLIEQIAQIKTGRRSNRILFDTIFKTTGANDRRIKSRKKKDILEKLLPHYKEQNFIKDFTADDDGINIFY